MTDRELLRRFVEGGDQGAYGELVGRHVDLVHGVARREVGEAEAGDVVQAVFLLLWQRAAGLRGEVSVSGWLFRTARLCCANARKVGRRRAHYERVAAMARGEKEVVGGERLAGDVEGVLDEALGSVPAGYREAVLMRYLEGRSVEETAAELGVSAAAAGKRATRGLEMLRGYFVKAGYRVEMQGVAGVLAVEAAKRAPEQLAAGIAGAVGSGAVTGHAATLATLTGKMLGGAKVVAALFVVLVAAVTVAGAAVYSLSGLREVKTVVAPVAATASAPVKAYVAGEPLNPVACVAWYNVLVDGETADAVRKGTAVAEGKSDFYELRRGKGEAVRELLKGAAGRRNGGFVRTVEADWGNVSGVKERVTYWNVGPQRSQLELTFPPGQVTKTGDGVGLRVDFDGERVMRVGDAWGGKQVSLHFSGQLAMDEAFVALGDLGDSGVGHLVNVTVYQVIRADASEVFHLTGYQDVGEWVENGPVVMRGRADAILVWEYGHEQGKGQVTAAEKKWTRYLKDGTRVTLERVGRPGEWPQCWWDAEGGATARGSYGVQGSGPVVAVVDVESAFGRSGRADIPMDGRLWVEQGYPLKEGEKKLVVDVATGPWAVKKIEEGDEVDVGDGVVHFKKGKWTGEKTCDLEFNIQVGAGWEAELGVATKDGKWVPVEYDFMGRKRVAVETEMGAELEKGAEGTHEYLGFTMPVTREAFDHWVLLTRARGEQVVFEGFAMEPVVKPRADVTEEEVKSAERKADWELAHAAGLRLEEQAEKWDGIARNEAVPLGAMRVMIDKARAGDVADVEGMMTGDAGRVEMAAEWFVMTGVALRKCEEKFGRMEMLDAFSARNESISLENTLLRGWEVTGETAVDEDRRSFLVKREGKWKLDVDRMEMEGHTVEEMRKRAEEMKGKMAAVVREVEEGKIGTAGEAAERVSRVVFER